MRQPATLETFKRNYEFEGVTYCGTVKVKRIRSNMRYTLHYEKRALSITIRPEVSLDYLDTYVIKTLPSLIRRVERKRKPDSDLADNEIYLLGKKHILPEGMTREMYLRKCKKSIVAYFESRVRFYEKQMRISPPYKVRGEIMKTRYGSNSSQTHAICLDLKLYYYDEACLDSVVVHELAHDTHKNHGKRFYAKVLKYCPSYWYYRKRLLNRLYSEELTKDKGITDEPMEEEDDE